MHLCGDPHILGSTIFSPFRNPTLDLIKIPGDTLKWFNYRISLHAWPTCYSLNCRAHHDAKPWKKYHFKCFDNARSRVSSHHTWVFAGKVPIWLQGLLFRTGACQILHIKYCNVCIVLKLAIWYSWRAALIICCMSAFQKFLAQNR